MLSHKTTELCEVLSTAPTLQVGRAGGKGKFGFKWLATLLLIEGTVFILLCKL